MTFSRGAESYNPNEEPPPVLDAERSVLAAMMLEGTAIDRARALLDARHFFLDAHGRLFNVLLTLRDARVPGDLVTVTNRLMEHGDPDGRALVAEIMYSATTTANLEAHCAIVRRAAVLRHSRAVALRIVESIEQGANIADVTTGLRDALDQLDALDAAGGAHEIEFLDLAATQTRGIPSVPWIVDGWLAEQDIALVSGDGGIGKSTTVAGLAIAVATGGNWCGIAVPKTGNVVVIDEEQHEGELSRIYLRLGAPQDRLHVACQQGVNLTSAPGLARLERVLDECRPVLTVFDSVQQVFAGVDGNNAADVARVYAELFRLRRTYDTAFVLIGHLKKPPADGQVAKLHLVHGSVAFSTQASTVWVATQPAKDLLDLCQVKRRGSDLRTLRVRYATEGPDAPIVLAGEGAVEAQETIAERAQDLVVAVLTRRGTSPTKWIMEAAHAAPLDERAVERALKHLVAIRRVEKLRRGYYSLVQPQVPTP